MVRSVAFVAFVALASIPSAYAPDPRQWSESYDLGTPFNNMQRAPTIRMHARSLKDLNFDNVAADIVSVMKRGRRSEWPADFGKANGAGGNYGPQFVRLAWHCSGTYRSSDGKGGCGGAGQRFEPLRSWDDNTNLDKTRALLAPIKAKYGDALSWGDLIVTAGTVAMRDMGAPLPKMCLGRVDDSDGTSGLDLGVNGDPASANPPCEVQGMCEDPVGTGTIGLIYVNPEGPVVEAGGSPVPDPSLSAKDVRNVFARMDQDDRDTVALIGGGHAFGKSHGACAGESGSPPQGISPSEAYGQNLNVAWEGTCGKGNLQGVGRNTFTSGFEGPWTSTPTQWGNEFFRYLLHKDWEKFTGPGGHTQWRIPNATGHDVGLLRLTSDMALLADDKYLKIVKEFAADQSALDKAFADAWFALTHRGGTWSPDSRCDTGPMPAWVLEQNNNRMLDSDTVVV